MADKAFVTLLVVLILLKKVNLLIMCEYSTIYWQRKQSLSQVISFSGPMRRRKARRVWMRPGRTTAWWDNFLAGVVVEDEWKECLVLVFSCVMSFMCTLKNK